MTIIECFSPMGTADEIPSIIDRKLKELRREAMMAYYPFVEASVMQNPPSEFKLSAISASIKS